MKCYLFLFTSIILFVIFKAHILKKKPEMFSLDEQSHEIYEENI